MGSGPQETSARPLTIMALEEIIARLGVDDSDFKRGMTAVTGQVDGMKQVFGELRDRIVQAFTVGALLNLAKEAVQYASDITDAAEATRTGVVEYQALAAAARESGASMQQLDQALIKAVTNGEKATKAGSEMAEAFAVLGVKVDAFNKLPSEQKLEMLGRAYEAAGRSQEAYTALTDILGTKSAPRLIAMLQELGTQGFDAVARKAEAAGLILNQIDAQKLDHLQDQFEGFKIRTLVLVDEMISSWDRFFQWLAGKNREQIYGEEADNARIAARAEAIQQLIEQGQIFNQVTGAGVDIINKFSTVAGAQNKFGLFGTTPGEAEAIQLIEQQITDNVARRRTDEAEIAAAKREQAQASAREAEIGAISADNASALKMLEEGRALLKLKAMSDEDRLLALQGAHIEAVERLNNMELLGEGTKKEKEEIVKRVLDLEKQIGDTQAKIAADEAKAGEAREKKQKDLLELMQQQAALQAQMDAAAFNRYGRDSGDLADQGGGSTLTFWAQEEQRLGDVAQRQFDELARARARAAGGDQDAARELDRLENQFTTTEAQRKALEDKITTAQGGKTGDPLVDKMEDVRKQIKELQDELTSA